MARGAGRRPRSGWPRCSRCSRASPRLPPAPAGAGRPPARCAARRLRPAAPTPPTPCRSSCRSAWECGTRGWRWTGPVAVARLATAVNLADPGFALTENTWFSTVGLIALPVLIGRYLRGRERTRPEDPAPLLDLLLAGGGVAFAVLGTWPTWDSGRPPVWAVGLGSCSPASPWVWSAPARRGAAAGERGAPRRRPVRPEDRQQPLTAGAGGAGAFASRASWLWVAAGYCLTCGVTAVVIVDDPSEVTLFRVVALMAMVTPPSPSAGTYGPGRPRGGRRRSWRPSAPGPAGSPSASGSPGTSTTSWPTTSAPWCCGRVPPSTRRPRPGGRGAVRHPLHRPPGPGGPARPAHRAPRPGPPSCPSPTPRT